MSWGEKKTKKVVSKKTWRGEIRDSLFYFCRIGQCHFSFIATLFISLYLT